MCGGRDYQDREYLHDVMTYIEHRHGHIGKMTTGGAAGADTLAHEWAVSTKRILAVVMRADWKKYGKRAGPLRNQKMIETMPDLVVAFPGGRGTADMIRRADEAGVEVMRINGRDRQG